MDENTIQAPAEDSTELESGKSARMKRVANWWDGVALAMAVPALLLYSLGDMAAILGVGSIVVWVISTFVAVWLVFGYAELAGIFSNKTGGMGVFQYAAWKNSQVVKKHPIIGDMIGVIGIWGYWWAWSPVLAIGGLVVGHWFMTLIPTIPETILFIIPSDVAIGAVFLLILYGINYYGLMGGAKLAQVLALATIIPMAILALAPWFTGNIDFGNFTPFLPLNWATGELESSWFTFDAIYGILGGLFIAWWCVVAYEAVAVYTAEYKHPETDTFKAVSVASVLVAFFYILLPITALGVVGIEGIQGDPLLAIPNIGITCFGELGGHIMMVVMMLGILLALNQATNGGGRALYQMAEDGMLVKQFGILNKYDIPAVGMGFDIIFNIVLMFLKAPIIILAASAIGYSLVNILANLSVTYMRRKFPDAYRPFKMPGWMYALFAPAFLVIGASLFAAPVFGGISGTMVGLSISIIVLLVYTYRKKYQERPGWKIWGESSMPDYMKGIPFEDGRPAENGTRDAVLTTVLMLVILGYVAMIGIYLT
ncbi:APC family permease [Methanohalophilus sp. RSK]|uniref:APC family permease n=1 Tax=Methanohalophilus sp. RSK TaxID=2485783 RepID=UPI000F43C34A|nr:APC family permease [Methanohalophilus sp. RSK]RNI12848.1 APC family permease [Methanohalophilus sp. RSK]